VACEYPPLWALGMLTILAAMLDGLGMLGVNNRYGKKKLE
jgi:hypothetical protein